MLIRFLFASAVMFIRRSATRNALTGESYYTYRLVRSERIEAAAQRYAAPLVTRAPTLPREDGAGTPDWREVDVDSIEDRQPRSVGVEHLGLAAMDKLDFIATLETLGLNGAMRAAVIGNVIARTAKPASELASWQWLRRESALGELLEVDFEAMPLMRLVRASDALVKHRTIIEDRLFASVRSVFALEETITRFDVCETHAIHSGCSLVGLAASVGVIESTSRRSMLSYGR